MEETFDEDFEAQLYAQVYHDTSVASVAPETSDYTPTNLNKQSSKRYWQKSKNLSTQRDFDQSTFQNTFKPDQPTQQKPPAVAKVQQQAALVETEISAVPAIKTFVPYSSVLSFMSPPSDPPKEDSPNSYEKKKSKTTKFPKAGKLLSPLNKQGVTKGKSAMKIEVQAKKFKASAARKKAQSKVLATIELVDSDESDCIPIELPPPPLITLDSSDEEEQRKKKRAMSPSISSIISDDFIVAGDKRRLVNPFTSEESTSTRNLKRVAQQKDTLEKVKALTKVPSSTSSSDSARSSCERVEKVITAPTSTPVTRSKRKESTSIDNSLEDSIYGAKIKSTKNTKEKNKSIESSEEETPCVNAKNQKLRRRKSTSSRKKSTEGDSDVEEDPKAKLIASSSGIVKKRSRFITPSYNDDEFGTLISSIIRSGDAMEDEESEEENPTSKDASKAVNTNQTEPTSKKKFKDSTNKELKSVVIEDPDEDCEIIEKLLEVVEIPDEEDEILSDSDDSMKGFKGPVDCDLSLNVIQIPYEPHEYIRNAGENSQQIALPDDTSVNPEIGWNEEMKFFYDGSWGNEDFCISSILDALPRDQKLWRISNADRNRTPDSGSRIRCRKCNEAGHIAVRCTKPRKRVVCFMCGEEGHRETRCPNSICLRCGKPNRLFSTICQACQKLSKKMCPCCSYQGHDIEQCPDKWRRYHSTTTDANELNSNYQVNKRVYCSICARRGHFAENCTQFFKTISGLITSSCVRIVSHKPSYPRHHAFDKKIIDHDQMQLLSLITYFPFYRFNFQFARNTRIYAQFREQFALHMKRTAGIQNALSTIEDVPKAVVSKKAKKKSRRELQRLKRKNKVGDSSSSTLQISFNSSGNRTVTTNDSPPDPQVQNAAQDFHDDSNSNYSFSEFYQPPLQSQLQQHNPTQKSTNDEMFKSPGEVSETSFEKAIRSVKQSISESPKKPVEITPSESDEVPTLIKNPIAFAIALPDYIPLCQSESPSHRVQVVREPEVVGEARVMLTKEHFKTLTAEKGMNFIYDLKDRLHVDAQFQWDNKGNSLLITGIPSNQSMFHLEVREFLYQIELGRHEKMLESSTQLPRNKTSIVTFLKLNLQAINKTTYFYVKKMLDSMNDAEKDLDHKKLLKCRKSLNIAFIGHGELEDGGVHVGALRRILYNLEKELVQGKPEMNTELRQEIMNHMKPIFSTMDHGDYRKLFEQYLKVTRQRKKRKLVINPVILN